MVNNTNQSLETAKTIFLTLLYLRGVHPLVEHRGVAQGVGAAVVQTSGQAEHLATLNGL